MLLRYFLFYMVLNRCLEKYRTECKEIQNFRYTGMTSLGIGSYFRLVFTLMFLFVPCSCKQ